MASECKCLGNVGENWWTDYASCFRHFVFSTFRPPPKWEHLLMRDGYAEWFYAESFLREAVFWRRHFMPIGLFAGSFMGYLTECRNSNEVMMCIDWIERLIQSINEAIENVSLFSRLIFNRLIISHATFCNWINRLIQAIASITITQVQLKFPAWIFSGIIFLCFNPWIAWIRQLVQLQHIHTMLWGIC